MMETGFDQAFPKFKHDGGFFVSIWLGLLASTLVQIFPHHISLLVLVLYNMISSVRNGQLGEAWLGIFFEKSILSHHPPLTVPLSRYLTYCLTLHSLLHKIPLLFMHPYGAQSFKMTRTINRLGADEYIYKHPFSDYLNKVSRSIFKHEEFTAFTSTIPEATPGPVVGLGNAKLPTARITSADILVAFVVVLAVLLVVSVVKVVVLPPVTRAVKYLYRKISGTTQGDGDLESGEAVQQRTGFSWSISRFFKRAFPTRRQSLTPTVGSNELIDSLDIPLHGLNSPLGLPFYLPRAYTAEGLTRAARPALRRNDSNSTMVEVDLSPAVRLTGTSERLSGYMWRPVIPVSEEEARGRRKWSDSCETLV